MIPNFCHLLVSRQAMAALMRHVLYGNQSKLVYVSMPKGGIFCMHTGAEVRGKHAAY